MVNLRKLTGSGGGGASNSFTTIDCPSGTDPVADSATDTLTLIAGAGMTITGDSAADSVTFASTITQYTDEMAQDAVGGALTDSSRIDFTYNDGANTITADLIAGSVANSFLANMAQATVKGRAAGAGTGAPQDLTATQLRDIVNTEIDHGLLTGLNDDDHTHYALLGGRIGGQTMIGGTAANNNLNLQSTTNATRGKVISYDNFEIGFGTAGVDYTFGINGENNDFLMTWMEDEDYLAINDDIFLNSTEAIYFNDTARYFKADTPGGSITQGLGSCQLKWQQYDFGGGTLYPQLVPVSSVLSGSVSIMIQDGGIYLHQSATSEPYLYFANTAFSLSAQFYFDCTNGILRFQAGTMAIDKQSSGILAMYGLPTSTAANRRGGEIRWYHGTSTTQTIRGYTYVNDDNRFVWDSAAQATNTDAGNAWVDFDDGSASFASLVIGGGATIGRLDQGTYTPTLTNVANLSASTAYQCQWLRVGNKVTVSGRVDIDPTTAALTTSLGISLPVSSNIGASEDCAGVAFASGIAGQGAAILGDSINDRATMTWIAGDVTNQAMYFTFTYDII